MAKTNITAERPKTHEGAPAHRITPEQELQRSIMACFLWERTFYESGEDIAERIATLAGKCQPAFVADLAVKARTEGNLRHAPLWLIMALCKHAGGKLVADTIYKTINRADELAELIAMYWKDGRKPLPDAMKRGIARAFNKFDEYQFAKYDREGGVKLRDAMFLTHPKPKDDAQAELFKKIAEQALARPNTWESRMAAGEDKQATFTDLLKRNKLGYMALLRNLRGMLEAGVDQKLIKQRLVENDASKILPFRFIAAAKYAPQLVRALDTAMMKAMESLPKLPGKTTIAVDTSGSMNARLSDRSEMQRVDAAGAMAVLLSGVCDDLRVIVFATGAKEIKPYKGMALHDQIRDAIGTVGYGTDIGHAVNIANGLGCDRIIVVTDEQSHTRVPDAKGVGWMINVAAYKNGVGYGKWNHVDGFSEAIIKYIQQFEEAGF